jgi:hypothetical protein
MAIAMALSCGGGKKPAPKAAVSKTATPAASASNVPAGWPAETFAELTKPEMDVYVKVLPAVMAALKKANYKPVLSNPPDMVKDMGTTIEAMKTAAGVDDALKAGGSTWAAYRTTTYKVMAATNAMVMGMAEAMIGDSTSKEALQAKAMLKAAKPVFDQVPKANGQMLFTYMDQLKPLDDLDSMSQ